MTVIALTLLLFAERSPAQSDPVPEEHSLAVQKHGVSPFWLPLMVPVSFLAPGTGHLIRGDKESAGRIYSLFGVSFGTFLTSVMILAVTGAADAVVFPFIPLALLGASGWFSLAGADLVGMVADKSSVTDYPHRWLSDLSLSFRYRSLDDFVFDTKHYCKTEAKGRYDQLILSASYSFDDSDKIKIYRAGLGYQLISFSDSSQGPGLYGELSYSRENNFPGFFSQSVLSYSLRALSNLEVLSPHLRNMHAAYTLGLQNYLVTYHSPYFDGSDTNKGLTGGFELDFVVRPSVKILAGYSHARDTTISSITGGFTGVYYAGTEYNLWPGVFLELRGYAGSQDVFDLGVEVRF